MLIFISLEKKMKKFIFIFVLLFSIKAYSVLPPFYHSLNEIKAIVSDERLAKIIGSAELILDLKRVQGGYLLTTNMSTLKIDVVYIPQELVGATKFELKFHEKMPRLFTEPDVNEEIEENTYIED
jgi:hypothetical protein